MVIGAAPGGRPREAERWTGPGLWLALGVHGLLLLALALSMNWKMSDPAPVEAEVWSEIPRVAGGAAPPPPPPPREQPVVRRAPEPVKAADPEPEPRRAPDLVIAKTPPKKAEPRKPEPKPEPKPEVVKKPEPQKPEPRKDAPKPETVAKPSKATDPASRSLSAAELEAQRQANLQRMMSSLGGGSGGPGAAARSTGPSAGYAGRIIARIKPNIVFTESLNGNPQAVVEVRCAPDGRIMSRRLVSSSGVAAWDEAVLRALDRTEVLPADVDGRVPTLMQLSFKPRDF
ncbi:MAG: cell envelope integrity protein TolA [Aquabacterium sp.]|jgi:colicin import membrane protein|nr:cell envelope integrity protein TolA [Aquabacterium sp.]